MLAGPPNVWRLLPKSVLTAVLLTVACGTDAVGIETCREIEYARCGAAVSCGLIEDVEACRRFARDHCLHGVGFDEDLSTVRVNRCVDMIELAGRCAEQNKDDLLECRENGVLGTKAQSVCEIVQEPELAPDCEFLIPPEEEPEPTPAPDEDAGSD